jgi:3-oxoadipate enol-lactonase
MSTRSTAVRTTRAAARATARVTARTAVVAARTVARKAAGGVLRKALPVPKVPEVPPGRLVELPGRGSTFVVDVPGPPGAPVVVLLHALGTTGYLSWYPVLADLARDHRVIAFDQRWHGRGIRSSRFRVEDCADDVAALLDVLGVRTCIPVGYSLGGLVAQEVWHRHPDRVAGLVLAATARNFRGKRREQLFFPVMSAAMVPLSPYCRGRVDRVADALVPLPGTTSEAMGWGMTEFRSTSAWSMPEVLTALGRFNSAPWIGEVDVPTAVITTTRDRTIPVRRQQRLAACIKGSTTIELDGGHSSLVLRADRFREALLCALERVAPASEDARTG